jgi:hypothetical protein
VAEEWLGPKSEELAKARLASLRQGFETFEAAQESEAEEAPRKPKDERLRHRASADAFRAAVEAAGLEIKRRDYLNKAGPASRDPLADDEERRALFLQAAQAGLYELEADEVAEPWSSRDGKTVFLVRLAGEREVSIDEMSPAQYARYKRSARSAAIAEIGAALDLDFLRRNYGLWLYEDSAEASPAAKGGS